MILAWINGHWYDRGHMIRPHTIRQKERHIPPTFLLRIIGVNADTHDILLQYIMSVVIASVHV